MPYAKSECLKEVVNLYGAMISNISLENSVGFFDSNRAVQDFFTGLLEISHGYTNLDDLDITHDTTSFPAVDIGTTDQGIAIQITSRNDKKKLTDTLTVFTKNNLQSMYPRLVFIILGNKKNYDTFGKYEGLDFSPNEDIIDTEDYVKHLRTLKLEQLEAIKKYFEKYLAAIAVNRLYDEDIASAIQILKRDLPKIIVEVKDSILQGRIPNRNPDFIEKKNKLNHLDWDTFKTIQGHLQHNKKIVAFLSDPINEQAQNDYLRAAASINDYYLKNAETVGSIDDLMRYIFSAVNTYDDDVDSRKVKVLLHNMYFNCDIGHNPS